MNDEARIIADTVAVAREKGFFNFEHYVPLDEGYFSAFWFSRTAGNTLRWYRGWRTAAVRLAGGALPGG